MHTTDPESDPRTVDELFLAALTESDEDAAWPIISALHYRANREVLERAHSLCLSDCAFERRVGADVLAQMGVPERVFSRERRAILLKMLVDESDSDVLQSVLIALSHNDFDDVVCRVVPFATHADACVRYAAALALSRHEESAAIDCLITLSADDDSDVRDWATFGLGSQCDVDTAEIRQALAARLDDPDDDTRAEAIVGLARRNDCRAPTAVQRELAADRGHG